MHAEEVQQRLWVTDQSELASVLHDRIVLPDIALILKVHGIAHARAAP